jgi:tetratricopeptide (TPR) repeat protein
VASRASPYSISEIQAVETENEGQIRGIRKQEINQIRIALGRRLPAHRMAELYFRLAEIYMEAYRTEFLLEGRVHENRLSKGIPDKYIDRSHSRPHLDLGIKSSQQILKFQISFSRLDQVYYFLAFSYGELEKQAESIKYYRDLVQRFPNSPFSGFGYKELGEYYYKKSEFKTALEYLKAAQRKSPPESLPPLFHKMAWCDYRLKRFDDAIQALKEVAQQTSDPKSRYFPMREQALNDLAMMMAERGRVDEAIRYFQGIAGDQSYFPRVLEKLGRQYERNVELNQAIAVYESLLKIQGQDGHDETVLKTILKLIELDLKQKHYTKAIARLNGVKIPTDGNEETRSVVQNLRVIIRKTAIERHQNFRKNQVRSDLVVAESFYSAYVSYFLEKSDPHHELLEIQMYLAEVKRDLGKSNEAVALYRSVLQSKDPRYAKQAGMLWVSSLIEAMKKAPERPNAKSAPSSLEKEFVEASDTVVGSIPDSPNSNEAKEMALRAAQIQAGYASTRKDAIQRIQTILSQWPKSKQALVAAQLWLQLELDQNTGKRNPDQLVQVMGEIRGNADVMASDRSLNQGKLKQALDDQENRMKIGGIAKLEREQDFSQAAHAYEQFASETKDKEAAEKAYSNAISTYLKADNAAKTSSETSYEAILAIETAWSRRFPQSVKPVEQLKIVATQALISGQFDVSARFFYRLGTHYRDPNSLETAARLYDSMGDVSQAQKCWSQYLEQYKNSTQRSRIALVLARSQEKNHLDSEASRSYRLCAEGGGVFQSECYARLADLYLRNKDGAQAKNFYQKAGNQVVQRSSPKSFPKNFKEKKGRGQESPAEDRSPFTGYARYQLAFLSEQEVQFEPMKFPEKQLQRALNQRLSFLDPLSRAYQSAVQMGGPWAVAALHRLASFAYHFADEVDSIEPPSSLQGAALEKFRRDLSSVSLPLREKAKSTWNDGYAKASSLKLMSPVLPEMADRLADFRVQSPGRAQGPRGQFRLAGMPPQGGDQSVSSAFQKVREQLLKNAKSEAAWVNYGNLLWGDGKPLLAKIAYERALSLNSKSVSALNNLAVVGVSSEGEEDWVAAGEGIHYLQEALNIDDFNIPAKVNQAKILNYYRLFARSKNLWEQVLVRNSTADAEEGFAIALQGTGNSSAAESRFKKNAGKSDSKFVPIYHEAARSHPKNCVSLLDDLDSSSLLGFEKQSVEYLKEKCKSWKESQK